MRATCWPYYSTRGYTVDMFSKRIAIDLGHGQRPGLCAQAGHRINEPSVVAIDDRQQNCGHRRRSQGNARPHARLHYGLAALARRRHCRLPHHLGHDPPLHRQGLGRLPPVAARRHGLRPGRRHLHRAPRRHRRHPGRRRPRRLHHPRARGRGHRRRHPDRVRPPATWWSTSAAAPPRSPSFSLGGVVAQHSIRVGGNRFDNAIADYIRRTYGLAIGDRTAEIIKHADRLRPHAHPRQIHGNPRPRHRRRPAQDHPSAPTKSPAPSKTSSKKSSRPSASCSSKPRPSSAPTSSTAAWSSPAGEPAPKPRQNAHPSHRRALRGRRRAAPVRGPRHRHRPRQPRRIQAEPGSPSPYRQSSRPLIRQPGSQLPCQSGYLATPS
jgi:hypothetical protein